MPALQRSASQDEVLLDWYRSEAGVEWQREHRTPFEQSRVGQPEVTLAREGVRFLRYHLIKCKSAPTPFFDLHPTSWLAAETNIAELAATTAIDCWNLPQCWTVGDISSALPELRHLTATAA